jgi:hypothetical protein
MKHSSVVVGVIVVLGACPSSFGRNCGDGIYRNRQVAETIAVRPRPQTPAFYFRVGHFVVLLTPESVERTLDAKVRKFEEKFDAALLAAIRQDLPLQRETDLFKYTLDESRYLGRIEFVVADLLEKGDVTVIDSWELTEKGDTLREVTMVRVEGSVIAREFCSPAGDLLLNVTDVIE